MSYITGSAIRFIANFYDWFATGTNYPLIDPTSVSVIIYDSNNHVLLSDIAVKDSIGTYHYDWIAPALASSFTIEFNGTISGLPSVVRTSFSTSFE